MSRKNIVYKYNSLENGDLSQPLLAGAESNVAQYDTITYEASWSGGQATNGDIEIEYTRDKREPKTWRSLDFGTTISANGSEGSHLIIVNEVGFEFLRPKVTKTNPGATGLINISIFSTNKGA